MADGSNGSAITDMLQSRAGLAALFMALASLFMVNQTALNTERPSTEAVGNKASRAPQDVDTRLWQDPIQAINVAIKNTNASTQKSNDNDARKNTNASPAKSNDVEKNSLEITGVQKPIEHSRDAIYSEQTNASKIMLMAVMVSGAPTPEQHESRLRRRYALISALASKGYTPIDAEHIGYFKTTPFEQENKRDESTVHGCDAPNGEKPPNNPNNKTVSQDVELPETVPFEWFEQSNLNTAGESNGSRPNKVLVLWVDDTRFSRDPMTKTIELFRRLAPEQQSLVSLKKLECVVLGPNSSGHLKAMTTESNIDPMVKNIRFYSALATAADSEILKGIEPEETNLPQYLKKKHGIHLTRTIADDQKVIESLVGELKLRHISVDKERGTGGEKEGDHVVLLSDWDTFYGRTIPITFEKIYEGDTEGKCSALDSDELVHCFKYVRGIDGILPGASNKNDTKSSAPLKPEFNNAPRALDRPDGMSQKDYLLRTVAEIRKLDIRLRQKPCFNPTRRCGVAAIGVLGYDVYDKLMILQALRPFFPNKIFFTTGLSASYWSPTELPYTHNLIVASSFGLALNPKQQKDIPPFRDSYQTAFFLSALMALDKTEHPQGSHNWFKTPRIFEIGRNGPVDLSDPANESCSENLSECANIHPPSIMEFSDTSYKTILKLALGGIGFILLYLASWRIRKWTNHIFLRKKKEGALASRINWSVVVAILLSAILLLTFSFHPQLEEPWLWFDGISIWPSELLRLVALVLCFVFMHDARERIAKNETEAADQFRLHNTEQGTPDTETANSLCARIHSWLEANSILSWRGTKNKPWMKAGEIEVSILWQKYHELGRWKSRRSRSLIWLFLFASFAFLSITLSGGLPVPARGNFAYYFDKILIMFSGLATLYLTMLVVDSAKLCSIFISHLEEARSTWPAFTDNKGNDKYTQSAENWGLDRKYTVYWLDIQFIALRTASIQKLIWYPVVPLLFLMMARSPIFDDWTHPPGLIVAVLVLLLYLLSCAFSLEHGAKNMRSKATEKLYEELKALRGNQVSDPKDEELITPCIKPASNPKTIDQLERMIKEIEGLKQGAFVPFFQQPWVEAVLALAGGAGGLTLFGNFLGTP